MAACGSLHHIFESPLPENPTLLESLSSWSSKSIKPVKHTDHQPSFTEIFGELHFKENPQSISSSSPSSSVFASIRRTRMAVGAILRSQRIILRELAAMHRGARIF